MRNKGTCLGLELDRGLHKTQWFRAYHVDDGKNARPVPEPRSSGSKLLLEGNPDKAKGDVGGKVTHEEDELEPRGQGPHVDGGAHLDLAVVPLAEDGRIQGVALYEGQLRVWEGKVPLLVVVEAHHGADLLDGLIVETPDDEDEADGADDDHEVVGEVLVLGDDGRVRRGMPAAVSGLDMGGHFGCCEIRTSRVFVRSKERTGSRFRRAVGI